MTNKINIIVDTSGSISENGKASVIKNLLFAIGNIFQRDEYSAYDVDLMQWSNRIEKIKNLSHLEFKGSLDGLILRTYLENMSENDSLILLSDGNFSTEVRSAFRNISKKEIKIYCMAIGADSDLFSLKSVSTYPIVFSSVDIINAISKVCCHLND